MSEPNSVSVAPRLARVRSRDRARPVARRLGLELAERFEPRQARRLDLLDERRRREEPAPARGADRPAARPVEQRQARTEPGAVLVVEIHARAARQRQGPQLPRARPARTRPARGRCSRTPEMSPSGIHPPGRRARQPTSSRRPRPSSEALGEQRRRGGRPRRTSPKRCAWSCRIPEARRPSVPRRSTGKVATSPPSTRSVSCVCGNGLPSGAVAPGSVPPTRSSPIAPTVANTEAPARSSQNRRGRTVQRSNPGMSIQPSSSRSCSLWPVEAAGDRAAPVAAQRRCGVTRHVLPVARWH